MLGQTPTAGTIPELNFKKSRLTPRMSISQPVRPTTVKNKALCVLAEAAPLRFPRRRRHLAVEMSASVHVRSMSDPAPDFLASCGIACYVIT